MLELFLMPELLEYRRNPVRRDRAPSYI